MVERCPPDWLVRADVLAALGTAYGEWAAFDKAIPYLQKALETEDMERQASLKVAEQLANFEVRWGEKSQQPSLIERGIDRLRKLVALAESGERLALLGSAYKRLAQLRKGKDRQAALEECAAWYERSARRKLARGDGRSLSGSQLADAGSRPAASSEGCGGLACAGACGGRGTLRCVPFLLGRGIPARRGPARASPCRLARRGRLRRARSAVSHRLRGDARQREGTRLGSEANSLHRGNDPGAHQ